MEHGTITNALKENDNPYQGKELITAAENLQNLLSQSHPLARCTKKPENELVTSAAYLQNVAFQNHSLARWITMPEMRVI